MLGQIRETIPLVRLCDSRIVDRLDARMQSPSINMLSLRTPTWIPQDSVYLVANPPVAQSRMPRPRYSHMGARGIYIGMRRQVPELGPMRYAHVWPARDIRREDRYMRAARLGDAPSILAASLECVSTVSKGQAVTVKITGTYL